MWTTLGDSLTEQNNRSTKLYHGYIADYTGIAIQNCGLSGTGNMRCHNVGSAFFQRVSSIDPSTDVIGNNMERYSDAIVEICRRRGVSCLDLYHCSNLHPTDESFCSKAYTRDDGNGVHPEETGHRIIAPRIMQFVVSLIMF